MLFGKLNGVIIPGSFHLVPNNSEFEQYPVHLQITTDTCSASDGTTKLDIDVVTDALRFRKDREYQLEQEG